MDLIFQNFSFICLFLKNQLELRKFKSEKNGNCLIDWLIDFIPPGPCNVWCRKSSNLINWNKENKTLQNASIDGLIDWLIERIFCMTFWWICFLGFLGIFKIDDSGLVARKWGERKHRPAMNYDKLSRSIRQYYKKGIMKKTARSQRLVYQFCAHYAN